jgi:hypothetical protein
MTAQRITIRWHPDPDMIGLFIEYVNTGKVSSFQEVTHLATPAGETVSGDHLVSGRPSFFWRPFVQNFDVIEQQSITIVIVVN